MIAVKMHLWKRPNSIFHHQIFWYIHTCWEKSTCSTHVQFFTEPLLHSLQIFGPMFCKIWLTSDVLCCTASILNLCAIALDRYYALHDPIMHAQRRTVNFVLGIIALVWFFSCVICSPPLLGWNDWPNDEDWDPNTSCKLTEKRGYIVYSSLGSFFIPLAIIIFVYIKIFQVNSIISRYVTM